jgi:hypothetical protein
MLGDRAAAEDVVQEAFAGLFRRWAFLDDTAKAPAYLRSAVLNGCRNIARRGAPPVVVDATSVDGADMALLAAEERRAVLAALRELPGRQREALVLRYFLDLPDAEIARSPGPGPPSRRGRCTAGPTAWPGSRWQLARPPIASGRSRPPVIHFLHLTSPRSLFPLSTRIRHVGITCNESFYSLLRWLLVAAQMPMSPRQGRSPGLHRPAEFPHGYRPRAARAGGQPGWSHVELGRTTRLTCRDA